MIATVTNHSLAKITQATIDGMHEKVKEAKTDAKFINLIVDLVRKCKSRDDLCNLKTLYKLFYNRVKYIRDPYQVEKIQGVWTTLQQRAGDCDDSSILMASAGGALGYKYRFVTIKAEGNRPEEWSHVYTQIALPIMGWVTVDISLPTPAFGYTPEGWEKKYWVEPAY